VTANAPEDCYSLDVTTGKVETVDHQRNRRESIKPSRSGTDSMEVIRRQKHFGISVSPAGKVHRQATRP
jgi:hypothetical protein